MKTTFCVLGILLLLSPVALADEPPAPASGNALHFRIEVGVTPGRVVTGWIDERKGTGTGYDAAFLDLDGDGTAETVQEFPPYTNPNTNETRPAPKLTIPDDSGTWVVDLQYANLKSTDGVAQPSFRWSVTAGDLYVWFINGRMKLYGSAEAAAEAPTLRLGPPFRFDVGTATRGPNALVRIGLKDVNGATMRLARKNQAQMRPSVQLFAGEREVFSEFATYG